MQNLNILKTFYFIVVMEKLFSYIEVLHPPISCYANPHNIAEYKPQYIEGCTI